VRRQAAWAIAPLVDWSPANACLRVEFHAAGQAQTPADPLNNDIVKLRDLMVNLKAFAN
jgi:hypothetical protein